ncbi:hypothetical protein [Niveispirillum sp. KHB5.9]|uniref:hypothetical protein n=1 Tax=Niveispirillum sp. KHB5.9 TaxID=3400269 RepID=UPI003A8A446E
MSDLDVSTASNIVGEGAGSAQPPAADIDGMAQQAMQLFNSNTFDEAARLAMTVLSTDPDNQPCLQIQGRLHNRDKEWAKALPVWQHLARLRPDWPEAHLQVARCLHRTQMFEPATVTARTLLGLRPDHLEALQILTQSLSRLDRPEELIDAYQLFIRMQPSLLDPRIQLGRLYRRLGLKGEAAAAYHGALSIAPDNEEAARAVDTLVESLIVDARNLWLTSQNIAAGHAVRSVLSVDPGNSAAGDLMRLLTSPLLAAARAAQQEGDPAEVQRHCQELLTIAPNHVEGLGILAGALARARRWVEAAGAWEQLSALAPSTVEPLLQVARCNERLQVLDTALARYCDVLAIDPGHAEAGNGVGRLAAIILGQARQKSQAGELEEAQRLVGLAMRGAPDNLTAAAVVQHIAYQWLRQGRAAFKAEEWDNARLATLHATNLDPGLTEAWQILARAAHRARDWQNCLKAWQVLHQADQAAFEPRLQLARNHRRLGELPQALHWFREALAVNPDHAEAREAVAELTAVK